MNHLRNFLLKTYFKSRVPFIKRFMNNPVDHQKKMLKYLLKRGADTEWGKEYGYRELAGHREYARRVPVNSYEDLHRYIDRMMRGETSVLWPGDIKWFSKSSGTTNARSKFIPVSKESLEQGHYKAGVDMGAWYIHLRPDAKVYAGYGLAVGGSYQSNPLNSHSWYGDISAVIMKNLPSFARSLRKPGLQTALMDEWEEKISLMARETIKLDITSISGVPTWMLVLLNRVLKETNSEHILEVWPDMEVFLHGAVSFGPYRALFKQLMPSDQVWYMENYNASEGYFAFQDDLQLPGEMILFTNHGIFYEFLPMDQFGKENPDVVPLWEVEPDKNYAVLISTNAGLWRYMIGDTVKFTSTRPYRIKITGRTKHFINVFGEEVVVENAESAIEKASAETGALVKDFTAAPVFMDNQNQGGHEWVIEFEHAPSNMETFAHALDKALQEVNSDYEAKRYQDMALVRPIVHQVSPGTFYEWMKSRGKLGGQHKVPRLSNSREFIEDILTQFVSENEQGTHPSA